MGATNSSEGKNLKFYTLKAKVDETNYPKFTLSKKVGDKWDYSESFDTLSGMLSKAEIKEKEYEGAKKNIFVLTLTDEGENSQLEMSHNQLTYSILNAISADVNQLSNYSIHIRRTEKNGKFYGNAFVKIDGADLKWAFDPKSAPNKVPVEVGGKPFMQGGKQVMDDTAMREFYEKLFTDKFISKLGQKTNENVVASESVGTISEDQLPF